ncbi:unnamed protein product [Gordionus sp. m RMFG-2023]
MTSQVYKYNVEMTCEGCASAIRNVLNKLPDIENIETDVQNNEVTVRTSSTSREDILNQIKKTGKSVYSKN